jgi:hypothetical protein
LNAPRNLSEFAATHESGFGPITTFRCAAQFGRYRGIADSGQPNAL